jgi:asparagine synthetase B (glutamine-hydrolysing)
MTAANFLHIKRGSTGIEVDGSPDYFRGTALGGGMDAEGYFVAWRWSGAELTIRSEPWGFAPLFYAGGEQEIIVSPSIGEVLRRVRSKELDHAAIAVFLRLGFFVGSDTPWQAVSAMPITGRVVWRPGRPPQVVGDPPPQPAARRLDRDAAMDGYAALFANAVSRRLVSTSSIALPLTGGRDSRHILFELMRQGRPPETCVTAHHFPERADTDVAVARRLCAEFGLKHRVCRQPFRRFPADLERISASNYCVDEHTWALPVLDAVRAAGAPFAFDGIGGDVLSAGLFLDPKILDPYRQGRIAEVADLILDWWRDPEWQVFDYLQPDVSDLLRYEVARERLTNELVRWQHSDNPLTVFYFMNRTRREIAEYTFSMLGRSAGVVAPFLDRTLVEFLLSLPSDMVIDKRFHTDTIVRSYPQWAHLPFEDKTVQPRQTAKADAALAVFALEAARAFLAKRGSRLIRASRAARTAFRGGVLPQPWHRAWLLNGALKLAWLGQLERASSTHASDSVQLTARNEHP